MYESKEKAERAYKAYLAKKHDGLRVGKYSNCKRALQFYGFSEEEAEIACAKFLIEDAEEMEDSTEEVIDFRTRMDILKDKHPQWDHESLIAGANAYEGLKGQDAVELSNIISRSRSLSLARFSRLIKEIKTRKSLKAPHMGILPQKTFLPMKNLNRLQTKLEKTVTEEAKWLTAEQYEQRKQYARYMRKTDSEDYEPMSDEEFTREMNLLCTEIIEYFDGVDIDDAIEMAFEPPRGDNAWILSDEAEIISMNDGLNNIIKAPIILAKEMIQAYQVKDEETGEMHTEYHFKPYEELEAAGERIGYDGELDMIIEHQDWYDVNNVMGMVKQIKGDPKTKSLRGMGYFYENRLPKGLLETIKAGQTIPVSIGFLAKLGDGGYYNGVEYDHTQRNIILRHLAICLESIPRCPAGVCGINLEDSENKDKIKIFSIIKKPNYYINICKLFNDSETETNKESSIIKKQEKDQTMQEDSEGKLKVGGEPKDLEAILTNLRKMLNDEGWTDELKQNAIARILSALGVKSKSDSKMEDEKKEFEDAIAKKDAELEELKVELEDAKGKIAKFEEEKRKNLIKKIKSFGDKYSDEELDAKDLSTLKIIADAVSKFSPSEQKPEVLPVPPQADKEKIAEELKGKRIDFSKVFDDINKEFGIE